MVYNNVTNTLRNWCWEMTHRYSEEYTSEHAQTGESLRFLRYKVTSELHYKLGTLVDRDFPDYAAYVEAVSHLIPLHIDFTLNKDMDDEEASHVRTAETAFRDYLNGLSPDCPSPVCPYCRIIRGEEADAIAERVFDIWGYDTTYWYPLNGQYDENKLFISPKRLEPYMDQIRNLLGLPQNHIYEYGEAWFDLPHCAEVDALEDYCGCETAYIAKDLSWIIYYSHEDTVTFAGTILTRIREILWAEKEYWNQYE